MKNKKLGAIALATALLFSTGAAVNSNVAEAASFKDVSKSHWSYNSVDVMSDKGIVKGYGDGTFKPNQPVTRAHSAMFLARALKLDTSSVKSSPYKDVKSTTSGYKEIVALQKLGVFASAEKFNPNMNLSRAQMAKIIVESYNLKPSSNGKSFKDVSKSHWSYDYINTIAAYGITSGAKPNEFQPNSPVTRAQMVAFLHRTEEAIAKNPSIVKGEASIPTKPKDENPSVQKPTIPVEVSQPSVPVKPTEPTKPTKPTEPTTPVEQPSKPTQPTEPTAPTEPTEPTNPTEPTQPTQPDEPVVNPNPVEDPDAHDVIDTKRNYSKHEGIQDEFVRLLSEYRQSNGLSAVTKEPVLTQVAGFRSWDMALNDYFSHYSPTYGGFGDILETFRPEQPLGTEVITSMVIGRGATGDARAALDNFKNSSAHNEILLLDGYDKVGIGIDTAPDGITTILTVVVSY